ncbi:MAG: transglutaminase domain-containing protein [Bacteroidales bacterium]|nr:transglutaminase domain-containing protein [Bacteroidales bacterium]
MKRIILIAVGLLLLASCGRNPHFITDKAYRDEVHADFEARISQFPILNSQLRLDTLCQAEKEAMEFLYAYMPLSDLADYEPAFYLDQVRYAFRARKEMPWGKEIPEDVFRHFVLVYRVNNENLDTARMVFFRELKERVKGMTMEEAALEVNHWCHEHVAYRASDSRTSAPLATMRTSLGRCGEESTFTVTALRAVGIPARQCYTPRWAHCDDNHAWVEVYVNGEWKFLGACEPDPRLNMGWFSVPSTRCMMVHTKAFGKYKGDEEVVKRTGLYSELNLLSHYAPTRKVMVSVIDGNADPVEGAQVKFKLYNYAEYYTLATVITDKEGKASLTTGLGDLLIWATMGQTADGETLFAFDKIDVRQDSTLTLRTDYAYNLKYDQAVKEFEMVPPVAGNPKVVVTEEETAANAKRLAYEDSLRNAYTATFPTKDNYKQLLKSNPNLTDKQAWEIIHKSEGNYAEIAKFINNHCDSVKDWDQVVYTDYAGDVMVYAPTLYFPRLYDYLCAFSEKDLRDITADVLESHWTIGVDRIYMKGILPARISNEMVRPYREELAEFKEMKYAENIFQWVSGNIVIDDSSNYYNCPISPVGVYKLRRADRHSRDIFFVAACRAAGIPAYLDNATNTIYATDASKTVFRKVDFNDDNHPVDVNAQRAKLTLTYRGKEPAKPIYWPHFTLAKFENGDLHTFDFEDDPRMASFPATIELEPGTYCLSTGNRYPDGAVRSRMEFFEVTSGEKVTKEIVILPLVERINLSGMPSAQPTTYQPINPHFELFDGIELWDYAGESGMLYINLGNYSEPSKHLVVELKQLQKEIKAWGGMTFMVGPATVGMPSWGLVNTDFAYRKGELEQRILEAVKGASDVQYPLVALIDKEGYILYHSEGYKIGVVEQVLKAAAR